MKNISLSVNAKNSKGKVSDTLFGLFLEDINHSCDGGLNANMVRNHSFDDIYLKKAKVSNLKFVMTQVPPMEREADYLRYWHSTGCVITSEDADAASPNSRYAHIVVSGKGELVNRGYPGKAEQGCGMYIAKGKSYTFSAYIRSSDFRGKVSVWVRNAAGTALTETKEFSSASAWARNSVELDGKSTGLGELVISFDGSGSIDLDCVELYANDYWGCNDPKWSQGKLRRDLVQSLKELKPAFLRFPGGCVIEGLDPENEYHWKDSVGPLIDRKQDYNLWAYEEPEFGYVQSRQVGFYEYFLLCEDLGMEPLPVVWAGMNCQMRRRPSIPFEGEAFERDVIQNALDLIEYANGDPATSKWAKLRAEAGHPAPFHMKFIGIGNENFGPDYLRRFRAVKERIDAQYPGITCILGSGSDPDGKNFDYTWQETKNGLTDVYVDEHFYKKPSWVIAQHTRYDHYDRKGAKVFLGEYAAYDLIKGNFIKSFVPNAFDTALAEAAFLTGIERNADVVAMTCYAPLFAQVGGEHWRHNLIFFNPHTVMRTANYYVQQMYSTTVGKRIMPVEGAMPNGVFASATGDEKYLCIKLVNTTGKDVAIDLSVAGITGHTVVKTTLSSGNLRASNTLDFEGEANEPIQPKKETLHGGSTLHVDLKAKTFSVLQIRVQEDKQ